MAELRVLELGGDARERGRVHGEAMAAQVRDNVETYLARFRLDGMSRQRAVAEGGRWAEVIGADNPEYADEMAGIAEGAGLPLAEVAMLNARYEITYGLFSGAARGLAGTAREVDGCTSFGLLPEATRSGHTVIGQNWDWLAGVSGRTVVLRVERPGKPDFVGFTEAGIAGCKMGVNEAGIGLVVNGLITRDDGKNKFMKAFHVRCREVLDAWRMDKALLPIVERDRVCSANIIIGHADGEVIDIEAAPDSINCLYPEGGLITHANHFVHPKSPRSEFERLTPGTLFRATRLDRLLRANLGALDLAHIQGALSDHFSRPASICKHEDAEVPEARRSITVASLVIDLSERLLMVSDGQPCENDYQAFPLHAAAEAPALPETVAV